MIPTLSSFSFPRVEVPNTDLSGLIHPNYKTVNKLIMVGNGFDLAHSLRSGFQHFVYDYIKKVIEEVSENLSYTDDNITIRIRNKVVLSEVFTALEYGNYTSNLERLISVDRGLNKIKSKLFREIIREVSSKKWVDIEVSFYESLISHLANKEVSKIETTNSELESIRHNLIEYLKREEDRTTINPHPDLLGQFQEPILKGEALINTIETDIEASSYYFLNFNYTNILKKYVEQMPPDSSTLNYIHGALNTEDSLGQEPIFGFGDELDKNYSAFEDLRDDSAFEHIKSFKYLEAENYRNLMEFIEGEPFQVCIFGHSCGVSDRTMLNKIFEHENCISIKVYYYQDGYKNDYTTKNYSIARCFKDKSSFRNKVVNFTRCSPMVQPSL